MIALGFETGREREAREGERERSGYDSFALHAPPYTRLYLGGWTSRRLTGAGPAVRALRQCRRCHPGASPCYFVRKSSDPSKLLGEMDKKKRTKNNKEVEENRGEEKKKKGLDREGDF